LRFLSSNGISFDEHLEAQGMIDSLRHGHSLFSGRESSYQAIVENLEYYGVINKVPGLLLWLIANPQQLHEVFQGIDSFRLVTTMEKTSFYLYSHLTSMFFFLATIALVLLSSRRLGLRNWLLPGLICLWWPSLVGHSFMNIKDIPFAFIYTAFSYSAIIYLNDHRPSTIAASVWFRGVLAGILVSLKVPALVPLLITESVIQCLSRLILQPDLWHSRISLHRRFLIIVESVPILLGALIWYLFFCFTVFILVTPSAWEKPAQFFFEAYSLHTNHYWGGCTWLSGFCDGKAVDPMHWDTMAYVIRWFFVQTPAAILLLLSLSLSFSALVRRVRRARKHRMQMSLKGFSGESVYVVVILQAFLLPALALINNSALYGALRHLSFALPPLAILGVVGAETFLRGVRNSRLFVSCLMTLSVILVIDSFLINPFQDIYINELARMVIDRPKTELDYWGASSGELMAMVAKREPDVYGLVNGYRPMISVYHNLLGRSDVPGGPRFKAEFTVDALQVPLGSCRLMGSVNRSLIGVQNLLLSRAYICQ
jgi:hypothetical protein